jgi:hypothetical protein
MPEVPHRSDSRTHWHPKGPRRAAADQAGLRPMEWRQLEQLVEGAPGWVTAKATAPVGAELTGQEASVGLRNLRSRGLAEYSQDVVPPVDHDPVVGLWRASQEGFDLVMAVRDA